MKFVEQGIRRYRTPVWQLGHQHGLQYLQAFSIPSVDNLATLKYEQL